MTLLHIATSDVLLAATVQAVFASVVLSSRGTFRKLNPRLLLLLLCNAGFPARIRAFCSTPLDSASLTTEHDSQHQNIQTSKHSVYSQSEIPYRLPKMQISLKVILTLTAFICSLASAGVLPKPSDDEPLHDRDHHKALRHVPLQAIPPMKCRYPFKNFTQLVNHSKSALNFSTHRFQSEDSSNNTDTFDQQYQIILDHEFYRPGGPIFFVQGGESQLSVRRRVLLSCMP